MGSTKNVTFVLIENVLVAHSNVRWLRKMYLTTKSQYILTQLTIFYRR